MFFCGCSLFTQLQTGEIFPHRQQFFIFSSSISSHLQLLAGKVSPLPTLPFLLPVLVQLVLAVRYLGALWRRLTRIWGQELNTGVNCEFTYMEHFLSVESKSPPKIQIEAGLLDGRLLMLFLNPLLRWTGRKFVTSNGIYHLVSPCHTSQLPTVANWRWDTISKVR